MAVYVVLLRGINVGGKNSIRMADLKNLCEELGYHKVETYIQSGNIILETEADTELDIIQKLEQGIQANFRLSVPVVVRSTDELDRILQECPFTLDEITAFEEDNAEGESFYVALLNNTPTTESIEKLHKYKTEQEEYRILGRDVYLLFKRSIRNSKLANHLQKLDATVTVRNWKTMHKLWELVQGRI